MPTFLSPEQCIALLPKTFTSIIPIKRISKEYSSFPLKYFLHIAKDIRLALEMQEKISPYCMKTINTLDVNQDARMKI